MDLKRHFVHFVFLFLALFLQCNSISIDNNFDDDDDDSPSFNRCPWIRNKLKNGRVKIRSRGRIAKFLCHPGYELAGKRFATCVRGQWNNPIPVCVSRGCSRLPEVTNGHVTEMYRGAVLVYDCFPGYTLIGSAYVYCDGKQWSSSAPTCVVSNPDPQMFCDFEEPNLCGWSQDPTHDFDWKRNQFSTPSGHVGTGPSFDHTFGQGKGGFYLYLEASSPRKENDTSRLFSPVYPNDYSGGCFLFWYHMYGSTTGGLKVYVKPESHVFNELPASWKTFGEQGNMWLRGNVTVPSFSENFQIVIEGIRGTSYIGDTAIDDVSINAVDCENFGNITENSTELQLHSCRGRCREEGPVEMCGCNDDCVSFRNCCEDFSSICTKSGESASNENSEEITKGYLTVLPNKVELSTLSNSPERTSIAESTLHINSSVEAVEYTEESPITSFTDVSFVITNSTSKYISTQSSSTPTSTSAETSTITSSATFSITVSKTSKTSTSSEPLTTTTSSTHSTMNSVINNLSTTPATTFAASSSKASVPTTSEKHPIEMVPTNSERPSTAKFTATSSKPSTSMLVDSSSKPSTTKMTTTRPSTAMIRNISSPPYETNTPSTSTQSYSKHTSPLPIGIISTVSQTLTTDKKTVPITNSLSTAKIQTALPYITSSPYSETLETRKTYNLRPRPSKTSSMRAHISTFPYTTPIGSRPTLIPVFKPIHRYRPTPPNVVNEENSTPLHTSRSISTSKTQTNNGFFTTSNLYDRSSYGNVFDNSDSTVFSTSTISSSSVPKTQSYVIFASMASSPITRSIAPATTARVQFRTQSQPSKSSHPSRTSTITPISSGGPDGHASKSASTTSKKQPAAFIVPVLIVTVACIIGLVFYIRRRKALKQSKLSEDSEMRFLSENEVVEYSDSNALDRMYSNS